MCFVGKERAQRERLAISTTRLAMLDVGLNRIGVTGARSIAEMLHGPRIVRDIAPYDDAPEDYFTNVVHIRRAPRLDARHGNVKATGPRARRPRTRYEMHNMAISGVDPHIGPRVRLAQTHMT